MTLTARTAIDIFDSEFRKSHEDRIELVRRAGDESLFREIGDSRKSMMPHSVGTFAIRSAAAVEQMINGITVRLWDDPFEWTLPEQLPTVQDLIAYFNEVEAARIRGFKFLTDDADLQKQIPAPIVFKSLDQILSETIERSGRLLLEAKAHLLQIEMPQPKRH